MYYSSVEEFCNDWGYDKTLTKINSIKEYFDLIMEEGLRIEDRDIVVSDSLYKRLRDIEKYSIGYKVTARSRKTPKYVFREVVCQSQFENIQKDNIKRERQEERQKEKRLQGIKEQQLFVEEQKKQYGSQWKDERWIEQNIGKYYTLEPMLEYYWTIIGKDYKRANWQGDIKISKKKYDTIINMEGSFSGYTFLNRTFQYKGYSHKIIGYYEEVEDKSCGIYGIYRNDELIYIGMTNRSFQQRWREHQDIIEGRMQKPAGMVLYDLFSPEDKIEYKELIDCSKIKSEEVLTLRDLKAMELALISLYQPVGNYSGVKAPYRWN